MPQEVPKNLRYTTTHEWVSVDGSTATVGITAYAVEQLSDLVFIELPSAGAGAKRAAAFGEIESTKTVSELFAPVSGTITEVNSAVADDLDLIKNSPYGDGWLVRIDLSDSTELEKLLTAEQYRTQIAEEDHG